jgi:hypothetical protein
LLVPLEEPLDPLLEPPLAAEPLGLLGLLPLVPEEPMDDDPPAALPVRDLDWFALDPAPALSRLHPAMPRARTAAVSAAVRVFRFIRASPLKWTGELRLPSQQRKCRLSSSKL